MPWRILGITIGTYLILQGWLRPPASYGFEALLAAGVLLVAEIGAFRRAGVREPWVRWFLLLQGAILVYRWLAILFLPLWLLGRRGSGSPDPLRWRVGRRLGPGAGPVYLAGEDRFLHVHVLGPTGTGKSHSALWPSLAQDLATPGVGLSLLDPKGDLAARVAGRARELGRRVHHLDPYQTDGPGYNPLAGPALAAAERLTYVLAKGGTPEPPFFDLLGRNLLRYSVLALKEVRGDEVTLADLELFWQDDRFQLEILRKVREFRTRGYFLNEYGQWTPRVRTEYTLGLRSRLGDLLVNPELRRLLTAPDGLDLEALLAEGGVLLAVLPVDRLGVTAQVLGGLLLAGLQWATFSRSDGPAHFIYVDEFQNFARPGFGEFLAAARSYRVGAVLAHQNLGQLPEELRGAVLTNARNRLVFGGLSGADRREILAEAGQIPGWRRSLGPWGAEVARHEEEKPAVADERLRRLPRGRFLALLTQNGSARPPLWVRGEPERYRNPSV